MNRPMTLRQQPDREWPISPLLLLYVIVPLVLLAVPLALFRVTVGPQASLILSLYLWSATVMVGWLAGALGSEILYRTCRAFRPPLWVITLVGPLLIGIVLRQPIVEILSFAGSLHPDAPMRNPVPPMELSWAFIGNFLVSLAPGTITWISVNYLFDRLLDVPRYRYSTPDESDTPLPAKADIGLQLPELLDRLPPAQRGNLLALRSDDHYVRVYTDLGETLILARLRDAIDMARPVAGIQVHRSNWVACDAIATFQRTGHTGTLILSNGMEVPVSRTCVGDVEQRLHELSMKPR